MKVVEVADTVMIPVPDVDKGKIDQIQLPAIIMEVNDSGNYKYSERTSHLGKIQSDKIH